MHAKRLEGKVVTSLIFAVMIMLSSFQIIPASAQTNKLVFAFDTVHSDVDTVIQGYVTDKGWSTISLNKPLTLQYLVDSNVKVLHLSKFKKAFTDQEMQELKSWVDSGGIVMLAARYDTDHYWADLTRGFGITYSTYGDYRSDPTWTKEIADHPLLTDVQTLNLPYVCTFLSVRLPSTVLMTAEQGNKGAIVALYESKGKLLVYAAQGDDYREMNYYLGKDNYLFLGNALRWFGQTATATPTYVTTTTATKTTTSVSTVTQTTLATTTTTATVVSTTATFRTTTSTTTITTSTPVFLTTTSVTTSTSTTAVFVTTTKSTTIVTTSTDYANRAIVINGSTFVLSSEVLAGIAAVFLVATVGLFLMIRRTVRQHAAK